jgi:hypothetical protein
VSAGRWDVLDLVLCALLAARFFHYYVAGVHFEDRAMPRPAMLAFLVSVVAAAVFLVRKSRASACMPSAERISWEGTTASSPPSVDYGRLW